MLKKIIYRLEKLSGIGKTVNTIGIHVNDDRKNPRVNIGQLQAFFNNTRQVHSLQDVEFQVFSQFGDDGIIQWLVHQLPIPNKTFIEFGVENYKEANTRFLLINNQWSGLVMDGDESNVQTIQADQVHTFYDLQAIHSFITAENINNLISKSGFTREIGILSVDIDGNDYWVLEAINTVNPVIIICEYNSLFGFEHPYTIEYKHNFVRGQEFPFQFYGTSLRSVYNLAKKRGYSFIGCNSAGNNAYFIKDSFMQHLPIKELTLAKGYVFANFTEAYNPGEKKWLRGIDKIMSIDGLPVFNTEINTMDKVNATAIKLLLSDNNKLRRC